MCDLVNTDNMEPCGPALTLLCCRTRGEELKAAVGEWQSRHALERVLTTGFLDGTHPIVDTYELKVGATR